MGIDALRALEIDLISLRRVNWHEVDRERMTLLGEPVVDFLEIDVGFPFVGVAAEEVELDVFRFVLVELVDVIGRLEREFLHRVSP